MSKNNQMKKFLLLALLIPTAVSANTVTPQFTQGSMNATTTTTQTITEVTQKQVFGAATNTWSGSNVTPSADISGSGTTFTVTDTSLPWTLETTSRAAGLVEQWDTTTNYTINSTTTSLSVFSQ